MHFVFTKKRKVHIMSKTSGIIISAIAVVAVVAAAVYFVDVDQTKEARLPDVNVDVQEGQMPEYDIQTGSISVGSAETEVTVPDVDVSMEEKTVTVPTLNVEPAPAD